MPAIGVLLLLAQIACAVHVVRTGRNYTWIYIVVFVPVVGMAAYLIAEILPDLMRSRPARQAAAGMANAINPGKHLREAMRRVEITPTAENKATLAEEYLIAGRPTESIALYREALTGIHATDPGMMLGLARALFARGDAAQTQAVLERLREANPEYNSPDGISSMPAASRSRARAERRSRNMRRSRSITPARRRVAATPCCCSGAGARRKRSASSRKCASSLSTARGTNAARSAHGTRSPSAPSPNPEALRRMRRR